VSDFHMASCCEGLLGIQRLVIQMRGVGNSAHLYSINYNKVQR